MSTFHDSTKGRQGQGQQLSLTLWLWNAWNRNFSSIEYFPREYSPTQVRDELALFSARAVDLFLHILLLLLHCSYLVPREYSPTQSLQEMRIPRFHTRASRAGRAALPSLPALAVEPVDKVETQAFRERVGSKPNGDPAHLRLTGSHPSANTDRHHAG